MNLTTAKVSALTPHPDNPNTHPAAQITALSDSLAEYTQVKNVVVWNETILAGHAIVESAKKAGLETLDVIDTAQLGWSREKATSFMLADIRLPDMGLIDEEAMVAALKGYEHPTDIPGFDEDYLESLGFEFDGLGEPDEPADAQIDKADELQEIWRVKLGDVWECGEHRVICGDCTDKGVVETVMRGDKIQLLLTDVPYDVSQDGRYDSYDFGITKAKDFEHFDKGFDPLPFLELFYEIIPSGANWFVFVGAFHMGLPVYQYLYNKLEVCSPWVWVKKFAIHNIARVGYAKAHELALYAWNKPHYFDTLQGVDGYDYGIFASNEGGRSYAHATSKPLALFDRIIRQLSDKDFVVCDPFLGSGTTLIACETLNRRCIGIELDPSYVAVTLQRYLDTTKTEPIKVSQATL